MFHDLNFILNDGEKAALVGINGAGKSTLLRLAAGKQELTSGTIITSTPPWYVPQHLGEFDTWTVAQALGISKKLEALHAILSGDTTLEHFTQLDEDWEIENKVRQVLEKWELADIHETRTLGSLSGGQQTKVFLAAMDMNSPHLVLFDEPSNHLDSRTRAKLYALIQQSKSTMLIVSHDRTLLNLMNKTAELSEKGMEVFGGNFDFYQQKKMAKVAALQARLVEQTKALKASESKAGDMAAHRYQQESRSAGMSGSIPRIIAGGLKNKAERSTARMLHTHEEKIVQLQQSIATIREQIQTYETLKIDIQSPQIDRETMLIDMEAINFRYRDKLLWNSLSFRIKPGDRVQISGENGSGKTTLLKIITRALQPSAGKYTSTAFSYYYLDQHYSMIHPELTVYEQVQEHNRRGLFEENIQELLLYLQFTPADFDKKCNRLSGGERMKLSLCCLLVNTLVPDLLILDEPTNNLDIPSLEVLTLAVKNYAGTLLVISHDDYFIREIGIDYSIHLT
nr:ATP-binding cassette domain-containing protein [Chitinophaga sp. Cy-1792]